MPFSEVKLFQVKPDCCEAFESLAREMAAAQRLRPGCVEARYMKRFYVFDKIGEAPRPLTKIVKCVKYFSYWQFDAIAPYAEATAWFFAEYEKRLAKLLIMPFDINCGETLE